MNLKAYGKINLALDVVRKREDGYHEVKMIMQTVDVCDELVIEKKAEPGIELKVVGSDLPADESNLAYKAAKILMDEFDAKEGVSILLTKNLPMAAGMAGGSSDAAAVLRGVNELFELGLDSVQLQERGVKLGADIPYCVVGGTMLSEGIGEILTPLKAMPDCYIVLAKPPIDVSTKFVYTNLRANELKQHPQVDEMIKDIDNNNIREVANKLENVLETVTVPAYPVIEDIKTLFKENGALGALMSGSGPTVFSIFDDEALAKRAYEVVKEKQPDAQVFLTKPVNL